MHKAQNAEAKAGTQLIIEKAVVQRALASVKSKEGPPSTVPDWQYQPRLKIKEWRKAQGDLERAELRVNGWEKQHAKTQKATIDAQAQLNKLTTDNRSTTSQPTGIQRFEDLAPYTPESRTKPTSSDMAHNFSKSIDIGEHNAHGHSVINNNIANMMLNSNIKNLANNFSQSGFSFRSPGGSRRKYRKKSSKKGGKKSRNRSRRR